MANSRDNVFVFIGDSITDAGRFEDPDQLGFGYVRFFRDLLAVYEPQLQLDVQNRGIGGDTIRHLARRWDRDVLDDAPRYLSISIGVNDVWRQLQSPPNAEAVPLNEFESTYHKLLTQTRQHLPECRIFMCEPTVIGEDADSPHNRLMPPYRDVTRRLAKEFRAVLVPMNEVFWAKKQARPSRLWTADGVHPLSCGHMLMALTLWDSWKAAR